MGFDATDPTARRRWEPEAQRQRDAELVRLHRAGDMSQRDIAKALAVSLGTVQHVIRRERKRVVVPDVVPADLSAELADLESTATYGLAADELAALERSICTAELAAGPGNTLARHRLRYCPW